MVLKCLVLNRGRSTHLNRLNFFWLRLNLWYYNMKLKTSGLDDNSHRRPIKD